MRRHFLAALLPPGSIGAEVSRLQDALFAEFGCASPLALPPLVPLGFLAAPLAGGAWDAAGRDLGSGQDRGTGRGLRISSEGLAWDSGHLWLRLDTEGAWPALRAQLPLLDPPIDGPDLPSSQGFWLGCSEMAQDTDACRRALQAAAPGLGFTSCSLGVLSVECAAGASWWRETYWEVVQEKPLRRRRAG